MMVPGNEVFICLVVLLSDISLPGQDVMVQASLSVNTPGQVAPPLEGGGLSQVRVLVAMPALQVVEQVDRSLQADQAPSTTVVDRHLILFHVPMWYSPGHAVRVHTSSNVEAPGQVRPPCKGAGLSHVLVFVVTPVPHVTEQDEGAVQADQAPSTG